MPLKTICLWGIWLFAAMGVNRADGSESAGLASWYGESHRGRLMANGKKFNPDRLTAASWFYPLGTKVCVTLQSPGQPIRSVRVTITDRGPARDLVREGRIIDLARAAFRKLAPPDVGLVEVRVERLTTR
jgi:rare lipoprotein A